MKPAIEIQNLGKEYTLAASQPYLALRDVLSGSLKNIFSGDKKKAEKFMALQDINLAIQPGERVGIIGRNGAGKSTLLKIISRITPPTTGKAIIRGRVGSLLEVGTGFHPELTGRENIYLNGSILGLKKAEIKKQEAAIIDFSGVERFIDTPLKHYSTGMELRLAFSVAAHLEPEILLIDEVLAVGDIEFQKKCIGKMEEVSSSHGRTILFVSHNLSQIKHLCNKALLLNKGQIVQYGEAGEVLAQYHKTLYIGINNQFQYDAPANENKIVSASVQKNNAPVQDTINPADEVYVTITVHAATCIYNSLVAVRFTNEENIPVLTTTNGDQEGCFPEIQKGLNQFRFKIPLHYFTPGRYSLTISWSVPRKMALDVLRDQLSFQLEDATYPGIILNDDRREVFQKKITWENR